MEQNQTLKLSMNEKMKALEKAYRTTLPAKSYAVIRVDGKGFSKYTRGLVRPFDEKFSLDMRETAQFMCENIDGAILGFTQSDEISIIISDLANENTQAWFSGQVQKIVSTSASLATVKFNSLRPEIDKFAIFDGRTHHLEGAEGVLDYLKWRQDDAIKNSVGMLASHYFSHKQLQGVPVWKRREMLLGEKAVDWKDLNPMFKVGSLISREKNLRTIEFYHNKNEQMQTIEVERNEWVINPAPKFDNLEAIGL